jgi:hypothetical protein
MTENGDFRLFTRSSTLTASKKVRIQYIQVVTKNPEAGFHRGATFYKVINLAVKDRGVLRVKKFLLHCYIINDIFRGYESVDRHVPAKIGASKRGNGLRGFG